MSKPVIGIILGLLFGAIDGATSFFYPETKSMVGSIMFFSGIKGLLVGLAAGFFARKVTSLPIGILFGGAVGLILAYLVAMQPTAEGNYYYAEIMIPGTIVGLLLGFATQKFGRTPRQQTA